jgi:predicted N-acetyltransferase YhbS
LISRNGIKGRKLMKENVEKSKKFEQEHRSLLGDPQS